MAESPSTNTTSSVIVSSLDTSSPRYQKNARAMADLVTTLARAQDQIREGGGPKAIEAQHKKGRLTARARVALLLDPGTQLMELGAFAAHNMYAEWRGAPGAAGVTGRGPTEVRLLIL